MMFDVSRCLLALALLLGACTPLSARTLEAFTTEAPPWQSNHFGLPSGYAVEVVKEIARRNGDTVTFHFLPWTRCWQLAQQRPGSLIFTVSRRDTTRGGFAWVGAIAESTVALWQLASRRDIRLQRIDDARAWQIGVVRDDFKTRYLLAHGFLDKTQLQYGVDDLTNLRKLLAGRLDLIAANSSESLIHLARSNGLNPSRLKMALPLPELSSGLGLAFAPGTDTTQVRRYTRTLQTLEREGFLDQQKTLLNLTLSSSRPPPR